jgi:site-specific recombinase XerC
MGMQQADGSVYERKLALARMEDWLGHPLLLATRDELMTWRAKIDVLAPNTIATYVAHARCFFGWAIVEGLATSNPAENLPIPPIPRRLPRPIGDDDLMYALSLAPQPVRFMMVLMAWVGLRCKEVAYLQRASLLDKMTPPSVLVTVESTKGWHERMVPLVSFVRSEIEIFDLPRHGRVFLRPSDGDPFKPWGVSRHVNDFLHSLGIDETAHSLRHWFGTKAYHSSLDLRFVQELMGHLHPQSTAGYTAYNLTSSLITMEGIPVPPTYTRPGLSHSRPRICTSASAGSRIGHRHACRRLCPCAWWPPPRGRKRVGCGVMKRIWLAIAGTLTVAGACAGLVVAGASSSSAATTHPSHPSHRVLPKWLRVIPATSADKRAFNVSGTCVIIAGGGRHSPVKGVGVIACKNGDEALLPG